MVPDFVFFTTDPDFIDTLIYMSTFLSGNKL